MYVYIPQGGDVNKYSKKDEFRTGLDGTERDWKRGLCGDWIGGTKVTRLRDGWMGVLCIGVRLLGVRLGDVYSNP